jgi:hypothetical protein
MIVVLPGRVEHWTEVSHGFWHSSVEQESLMRRGAK